MTGCILFRCVCVCVCVCLCVSVCVWGGGGGGMGADIHAKNILCNFPQNTNRWSSHLIAYFTEHFPFLR